MHWTYQNCLSWIKLVFKHSADINFRRIPLVCVTSTLCKKISVLTVHNDS